MSINYSVYKKLNFRIISSNDNKVNSLRWNFFKTEKEEKPNITLKIGRFKEEKNGCIILSHKYHVKKEYFFCHDRGRYGTWKLEIKNFESNPEISLDARARNIFRNLFLKNYDLQDFIIPFCEVFLFKKGVFMLHGGAAVNGSQAYIFSGRSGSYKTTILLDLIRHHGFKQMSDDRVLISDGFVCPFPRSTFFFNYLLNNNRTEEISLKNKIDILFSMLFKDVSKNNVSGNPVQLSKLFFVSRMKVKNLTIRNLSLDEGTKKLVLNNLLEYTSSFPIEPVSSFLKYIHIYSLIYPDNIYNSYWNEIEQLLKKLLQRISLYEIQLPLKYESAHTKKIQQFCART